MQNIDKTLTHSTNSVSPLDQEMKRLPDLPQIPPLSVDKILERGQINSVNSSVEHQVNLSSEAADMEKYLETPLALAGLSNYQLESEDFLSSLPPIKPINLEPYAPLPAIIPRSIENSPSHRKSVPPSEESLNSTLINEQTPKTSTPLLSSSSPEDKGNKERVTPRDLRDAFFSPHLPSISESSETFATPNQSTLFHSMSAGGDQSHLDDVLRQKAKLQGQLEILTEESQSMKQVRKLFMHF